MKGALIAALVCVNIVLALMLVFGAGEQPAQAQAFHGQTDYLMCTGSISETNDAMYMLDLASRRLVAFESDPNNKFRLRVWRHRQLRDDFEYPKGQ